MQKLMCGVVAQCFLSVLVAHRLFAAEPNIDPAIIQNARKVFTDFVLEMEGLDYPAVIYSGHYLVLMQSAEQDGEYSFTGFRAVDREGRERFWQVREEPSEVPIAGLGFCFDELNLGDTKHWFASQLDNVTEYDPKRHSVLHGRYVKIDPRDALFLSAGGLVLGKGAKGASEYPHLRSENIVQGKKGLRQFIVTIDPKVNDKDWVHIVFDETQGMRPVICAYTPKGEDLLGDHSNARLISRMRWQQDVSKTWLPSAYESIDYCGGTPETSKRLLRIEFKCTWIGEKELPKATFEKDDLYAHGGRRVDAAAEFLKRLNKVQGIDGPAASGK